MYAQTTHCRSGFYYSCGRISQIWGVKPMAMTATPSERISYLARHKTAPANYIEHRDAYSYSCGRSSAIWETEPRVRSWSSPQERPRTASLARPKQTHPNYRPCKQVQIIANSNVTAVIFVSHRFRLL